MRALAAIAFLALAGVATGAVLERGAASGAEARAVAANGDLEIASSRDGGEVFGAAEIAPGDSAGGSVEIVNSGGEAAELVLSQHDLVDSPGVGGGVLSGRISLRVRDVTAATLPTTVYSGPLAPMPPQPAGVLAPGQSRRYEFVATLPALASGGAGLENAVQGASLSVAYSWTAREASAVPRPAPPPSGGGKSAGAGGDSGAEDEAALPPLRLAAVRVRRTLRHGRIVVRARCNRACRVAVRGRVRVRAGAKGTSASLRRPRARLRAGSQRLLVPVPHCIRKWLRIHRREPRLRARLVLVARDAGGQRATARRSTGSLRIR